MTELFDAMLLRTAVARLVPLRHSPTAMRAERLRLADELGIDPEQLVERETEQFMKREAPQLVRKQSEALHGLIRPTKKPDADNVLKAVCDGINGVVWQDDTQAVDVTLCKRYGAVPGVWVYVAEVQAVPVHEQARLLEVAA